MPKDKESHSVPEIGHSSRDQSYRRSLQPKSLIVETPFRHTLSQNYSANKKKVKMVPTIPEQEVAKDDMVKITLDNDSDSVRVLGQNSKQSKSSRKASQASSKIAFDNAAFEPDKDGIRISMPGSAANSARSSLRDPSVQSLTVVREQYCCCSRWTPCERALFATVGILSFIIIILVVAVILVSINNKGVTEEKAANFFKNLFTSL